MSMLTRRREMMIEGSWLPEGCVELEYIERNSGQYIDTMIYPNSQLNYSICIFDTTKEWEETILGGAGNSNIRRRQSSSYIELAGVSGVSVWLGDNSYQVVGVDFSNGILYNETTGAYSNFSKYEPVSTNTITFPKTAARVSRMDIYGVLNLLPILDSSGRPCMYDTIGKQYYYNQGTGEFSYKIKE